MVRTRVVVALLLLAPIGVAAQPVDPGEAAYQEGRSAYDLRQWDRAIEKFKLAYEHRKDAASLFNIAQSYRLKGDCGEALGFYKTYRRNFPDAANRAQVDEFITQLEPCAKKQQETATLPPQGTAEHAHERVAMEPSPTRRRIGLIVGGSGAALAIGSLVVGAVARSTWQNTLEHCTASYACDPEGLVLGEQARTQATIATVLGISGLVALGAGAVIYFTAPAIPVDSVAVAPVVSSDIVGVAAAGAF